MKVNPFFWVAAAVAGLGALASGLEGEDGHRPPGDLDREADERAGVQHGGLFRGREGHCGGERPAGEAAGHPAQRAHRHGDRTTSVGDLTGATQTNTAAVQENLTAYRNQTTFLGILQDKYGLTQQSAVSLARKSGCLASQVDKGGKSMRDAVTQAEAYANSNLAAQRPTTQLAQDMQDFANKTLTGGDPDHGADQRAEAVLRPGRRRRPGPHHPEDDQVALAKALKASGGNTGLLTQKQRDARGAFDTYISQVTLAATDAQAATARPAITTG